MEGVISFFSFFEDSFLEKCFSLDRKSMIMFYVPLRCFTWNFWEKTIVPTGEFWILNDIWIIKTIFRKDLISISI